MKPVLIILFVFGFYSSNVAQQITPQVINCSGTSFSAPSAKLTYNIGEIAITRIGNSNYSITQGFLQPKILLTSVKENTSSYNFAAYPNPTNGNITVKSDSYKEPVTVKLIDGVGREVYNGKLTNDILPLDSYQNGIYHLLILNEKQQLLEHKTITKLN